MVQKLKVLKIVFQGELYPYEIPAFRGAMAQKAGLENVLFHNHLEDGFRYRYPLIQYKCINRQPAIMCIGDGVDEIHHFFTKKDWSLNISERKIPMKIERLDMNQFSMQVWDQSYRYKIRNWIALNQKSYKDFNELESLSERLAFLERKLVAHILSLASGIDWYVEKPISIKITEMRECRTVKVKGVNMMGFNLSFSTNVFLPNDIGLGGKVSLGFGMVRRLREDNSNTIIN